MSEEIQDDLFGDIELSPEELNQSITGKEDRKKWESILVHLLDFHRAYFKSKGFDDNKAEELARGTAVVYGTYCGGKPFYYPSMKKLHNAFRDRDIFLTLTRDNVDEICEKHQLTRRHIYNIYRKQKALKEPKMF